MYAAYVLYTDLYPQNYYHQQIIPQHQQIILKILSMFTNEGSSKMNLYSFQGEFSQTHT